MQPVSVDVQSPLVERCEHLRRLAASHRRWVLLFMGLSVSALLGFAVAWGNANPNARLARYWSLGTCAFFALNAAASALKYRVLLTRLRDAERASLRPTGDRR